MCLQTLSLKAIRDPNTLMMRLRQDRHCLPEYVANLRYRAKRARINANLDHIVYSLKDLVASRYIDQLNFYRLYSLNMSNDLVRLGGMR